MCVVETFVRGTNDDDDDAVLDGVDEDMIPEIVEAKASEIIPAEKNQNNKIIAT